jgi:PIN domain nuclease of toxin-antitoxin system
MKILLDTCAFLWLTTDAPELSDKARMLFQNRTEPCKLPPN